MKVLIQHHTHQNKDKKKNLRQNLHRITIPRQNQKKKIFWEKKNNTKKSQEWCCNPRFDFGLRHLEFQVYNGESSKPSMMARLYVT